MPSLAATRTHGRSLFPALKGRARIIGRCRGRIKNKKYAALAGTAVLPGVVFV